MVIEKLLNISTPYICIDAGKLIKLILSMINANDKEKNKKKFIIFPMEL